MGLAAVSRAVVSAACVIVALAFPSCANFDEAWMAGRSQRAAHDQIMLVADSPPTLGMQRLVYQSRSYPDLAAFLGAKGLPDFLAETGSDGRRYLVFYFLTTRSAYAARTRVPDDRTMEFAGPYPMTSREHDLLRGLQQQHRDSRRPGT